MPKREDGKETKQRLLRAACKIFAEKGFRSARVAEICDEAGANVASVNYYFGDKENLYVETWRFAFQQHHHVMTTYSENDSPEQKLRTYIKNIIDNFLKIGRGGYFIRLFLMEMADPSGLIDDLWKELIEPERKELLGIICEIVGKKEPDQDILLCEMSIISQCKISLAAVRGHAEFLFGEPFSEKLINKLVDHITNFSLSGIKSIKGSSA